MQLAGPITPVNTIRQRIKAARTQLELSQAELARRAGVSAGTIGNHEADARDRPRDLLAIAAALGVDAEWLERGTGPIVWTKTQHAVEGAPAYAVQVAQTLSHRASSHSLPILSWEALMLDVPDSLFVLALRDDALAPQFPRGLAVVWSAGRKPAPGRLVLVRDKHGRDHARVIYVASTPGQWRAVALNPAFPSFDPTDDGLTILAVHRGTLEPEDDEP